jgi:hypothetical protein
MCFEDSKLRKGLGSGRNMAKTFVSLETIALYESIAKG